MDPEQLVQCPYDKSHQIRAARLPYHLVKCEKNNPGVARRLATCPFNARHRVPHATFQHHIASCPDKRQLDLPLGTDPPLSSTTVHNETPKAWQGLPCQEDWEAELQDLEEQPPFILRAGANNLLLPSDSVSILVGAPKANTSQPNVTQGGGRVPLPLAPHWRLHPHRLRPHRPVPPCTAGAPPRRTGGGQEPVGTCFLSIGNFSKFVEYAPCRSDLNSAAGQGYCQGGFSAEFTQVTILNGTNMRSLYNFSGEQMAAYFGYAVAATDVNNDGMAPAPTMELTGTQEFGRFGSAIAPLGDIDLDGFNDLLVGAFGEDTAVVYRGRPIVHASAALSVFPTMFNPEERGCVLEATGHHVPCINVSFCLNASGRHLPSSIGELWLPGGTSDMEGGGHPHQGHLTRNFSALSCELGGGNGSSPLVCDLGNPMKAGASIWGGLRFTIPQLSDSSKSVRFELQIRSKNANNSQSAVVPVPLEVRAATRLSVFGVSRPDVVTIPEGAQARAQSLRCEAEFRVLRLPYRVRPQHYPRQRLQVVTGLQWAQGDPTGVPVWVVVLSVLLGLLLLALLCYGLYKLGFFKRSGPYGTAMEKAQLKPQAASEA
ncbi:Gtsf1 [Columba livia]|nr:Gtsf1 [Columba livia]